MPIPESYVALQGSERVPLTGALAAGAADPEERFQVTVLLRPGSPETNAAAETPRNAPPRHGNYLSREEYRKNYSASAGHIEQVRQFAADHNLEVVEANPVERAVKLVGTVADFERAFRVELKRYEYPGGAYRGRIGPIQVPASLAGIVQGVFGLDNRPAALPHCSLAPVAKIAATAPPAGAGDVHGSPSGGNSLTVPQVAQLYNFPTAVNGTGQAIGLIELGGGIETLDLPVYFNQLGLPQPKVIVVSVDGGQNIPNQNDNNATFEVMLDIEVAGAIAPGARLVVYFAPNTDQSFINAVNAAVHDSVNNPSVISISWGKSEDSFSPSSRNAMDSVFKAAGLLGITVFVASGDDGSADRVADGLAHTDFPASSPNAVGCGGTVITASGGSISSEVVWNNGPGLTGGGGISDAFQPPPPYQAGLKIPPSPNPGGEPGRGVPDVCGHASSYQIVFFGQIVLGSGTSAVAPLWAGLCILLTQTLGARLGFLNPNIYNHPEAFRDITSGTNGAYSANAGWDPCTGLGSPNGPLLLRVLNLWHQSDLTTVTNAYPAVSDPAGYAFESQDTEHVVYRGADNHIHELFWDKAGWHHGDLTAITGAPQAVGMPDGFEFKSQGNQHVVYRSADSHIHELFWDKAGWHPSDLTKITGAPTAFGDPSGYAFESQGTEHVVYRSADGHIHELFWDKAGWHHGDLTAMTKSPTAAGDPDGFAFESQGTEHVVYRSADSHIHELFWDKAGWHHGDLTKITGAPVSVGDPDGFEFKSQGNLHVVYRSADGHIHELFWDAAGWHHGDLTLITKAPIAVGDPDGFAYELQGSAQVVYRSSDGHIQQLFWDAAGWHQGDLTKITGAPIAAGDPRAFEFISEGNAHVVYRTGNGDIHELWWGPVG